MGASEFSPGNRKGDPRTTTTKGASEFAPGSAGGVRSPSGPGPYATKTTASGLTLAFGASGGFNALVCVGDQALP